MIENKFKQTLKKSGILDAIPYYDKSLKYYVVIKVCDDSTADKFISEAEKVQMKYKASRYGDSKNIWVFKAYN